MVKKCCEGLIKEHHSLMKKKVEEDWEQYSTI